MILGVDVSTSITGFAVIAEGELVYYDYVDLRKQKGVFAKTLAIKEKIMDIFEMYQCYNGGQLRVLDPIAEYPIQHIYIEQPFTFFNSGGSSAKTMAVLQRFNGIVSWLLYELFEIEPEYVGATSARKEVGIKIPRGTKAKKVVMEYLLENESAFKVEYTRHGNPQAQYFDMADAIVVARAGYKIEEKKQEKHLTL
jgi:Holliday junction resolvasome RuvABC endonuclease subunit